MRRAVLIVTLALLAAGRGEASSLEAAAGKALFERQWVAAPSSTAAADGLGPLYNARSCNACHPGGGAAAIEGASGGLVGRGLVVRVAAPGQPSHPELGSQIQDHAVPGLAPEATIAVTAQDGRLAVAVKLRRAVSVAALFDMRAAPSLSGRAMIGAVDETAIIALADPFDRDLDGISGRVAYIRAPDGGLEPGRFGSKAQGGSLAAQVAAAALTDLGLGSPGFPQGFGDCTAAQRDCRAMPEGADGGRGETELGGDVIGLITDYLGTLRPPERPADRRGAGLLALAGCTACHRPALAGRRGEALALHTDLLLHDMGEGLAGAFAEGAAEAREWRTAPLIDLGPRHGSRRFLHDGRAATLEQAVLDHGGEAAAARQRFMALDGRDRQMLLDYLARL